jgi:hypothetical protein
LVLSRGKNIWIKNIFILEMEQIELNIQDFIMATRPNIYRNKKKYNRKNKHKNIKND